MTQGKLPDPTRLDYKIAQLKAWVLSLLKAGTYGMQNPMTAPYDLIIGAAGGDASRYAKGALRTLGADIDDGDSPYTVPDGVVFVAVDSNAADVDVVLPATPDDGRVVFVKKTALANDVIIDGNGALIDGNATITLSANTIDGVEIVYRTASGSWWLAPVATVVPGAQGTVLTTDAGVPEWRYKPEIGFLRLASPTDETDWFEAGSLDAKWTVFGSATTAFSSFGELRLSIPFSGAGTHALRGISQPVPAGNWTIAAPLANYAPTASMSGGLFASDGTKYVTLLDLVRVSIGTGPIGEQMAVTNWSDTVTPVANPFGPITVDEFRKEPWFQLRYDGSSLLWDWSPNGRYYQNIGSATIASFLTNTPTNFGLVGNSPVAAGTGVWGYTAFLCYHDSSLNH